ncbi:hypothetical protein, partial [Tritonibacter multivorans]|uniref:hypothetical protein n=1 Tax=Tritonibacter multivorans TaxID=928856 RepID=UPI00230021F1
PPPPPPPRRLAVQGAIPEMSLASREALAVAWRLLRRRHAVALRRQGEPSLGRKGQVKEAQKV